ncbi:hypothetical protein V494_08110, partial [Pseudogymnoascus sp. VKM F-4513 (FW-928)]
MGSWSSRFSKPEDAAELHAIFKGDNFDDGDASTLKRRRAGRSKLQKRFSRDSTLTNQKSRRSTIVGNSQENVARREEMKRIRTERLQEELGDIRIYDEDATPLCDSPFGQVSKNATNDSDEASQDDSLNAIINAYSSHRVDPDNSQPPPTNKMATAAIPCTPDAAVEETKIPLPPTLNPQTMPNLDDTSVGRTSWRLSFTSPQRARCLRALSLSNPQDQSTSSDNLTVPTSEPPPSPGKKKKWLNSKDRRPLEAQHPGTTSDGAEPQVPNEGPAIPLHEMQISRRLASAGTYIPSRQSFEDKERNHDDELLCPEEGFREINTRRSRYFRNVSGGGIDDNKVPGALGWALGDRAPPLQKSEVDEGLVQTQELSPGPELSLTILQGQNIVPSYFQIPRIVITKPDEPYGTGSLNRRHLQHSGEGFSSREGESCIRNPLLPTPPDAGVNEYLQIPEWSTTRTSTQTGRRPSTPLISKFTEEFGEPSPKSSFRSSLVSAMRRSGLGRLTKSLDGEDFANAIITERQPDQKRPKLDETGTPTRSKNKKESISPGRHIYSSMESAEMMWTKAFRRSVDGASPSTKPRERHPSPASKRSKHDKEADNAMKQRNEQTLTDETDSSRHSSQSTRSSFVILPESWANFPSHNRESRCQPDDGVARSDFAVRELLDGHREDAPVAKKPQDKTEEGSPSHHLPGRLTTKVRASFDRLITKQNKASSDMVYSCPVTVNADEALGDPEDEILSRSTRHRMDQKEVPPEPIRRIYQGIPDAPSVPRRGSMDDLLDKRVTDDDLSLEARTKINRAKRREKYKTWSGRDKSLATDMMALRQSTVDFMVQAQVMETVERERALRAADEVLK